MLKTIATTLGVILLLGYLLLAGVIYRIGKSDARYKGIDIVICDSTETVFVHSSNIKSMMTLAGINPVGKEITDFNTFELAQHLEQHKLVRKAHCYHTPDSLLRIDIYQRHPIMRVKASSGNDFYIDTDGEMMPVQSGIALHLPLVTGNVNRELVKHGLYDFALFLQDDRFWRSEIVQINIDNAGEVELIPRTGHHTILLGSFDDFKTKLDNLKAFYQKVLARKGWNSYKTINLKFNNQVIGEK